MHHQGYFQPNYFGNINAPLHIGGLGGSVGDAAMFLRSPRPMVHFASNAHSRGNYHSPRYVSQDISRNDQPRAFFRGRGNWKFNGRGRQHQGYCQSCESSFESKEALETHLQSHVKCQNESCDFEALEDIVKFHYKIQHLTGFADQLQRLDTPEEIEKWRSERRKNFPTTERVKQKLDEQAEKTARGEVLETQQFGKFKRGGQRGNRRGRGRGDFSHASQREQLEQATNSAVPKRSFSKWKRRRPKRTFHQFNADSPSSEDETVHPIWGLKKFEGIPRHDEGGASAEEGEITDSDSDVIKPTAAANDVKQELPGALQSLSQCYQSSSSDEKEVAKTPTPAANPVRTKLPAKVKQRCDRIKQKFTLLEMLLAPDIRRERNMILQCIRYISNNNFFESSAKN